MRTLLAGLAACILTGATGVADAQPATRSTVTVTLSEFSFAPKQIVLKAGRAYVLHLVDTGAGGHNFTAPQFFRAVTLDPDAAGRLHDGSVEVRKGESVDLGLTTGPAGTYPLRCTHPLHSAFGMKGEIVVQ